MKTATAPHLWALEIANILLVAERRGRIDDARRKLMAEAVQNLGVVEQPQSQETVFRTIMELASKHGLSSYDAAYLELAVRTELPLATLDKRLSAAASAEGVELLIVQ